MDKAQVVHNFWSSFGIPAYDENTVPDDATFPYITYSVSTGSLDDFVLLTATVWYRSYSWADITHKVDEITRRLTEMSPPTIKFDGGRAYFVKGDPFAQRMSEVNDDMTRRMYLQVNAEFLTSY